MSLTDINQDIDICLLKYIIGPQDFDINEVSKKIYEGLIENNKYYTYDIIKKRLSTIKKYRDELNILLQLPLMKQRSNEWFEARKTRLTASDLYDAIKGGNVSIKLAKKNFNLPKP